MVHRLAAKLFADYGEPLPAFQLFGGLRENGGLLESALALPRQPYYPRLHDKAGALLRSLIKNHPLVDGNKRLGMTATFVFLAMNHWILIESNEGMVNFALRVAVSEPDMTWQEIAAWLKARTRDVKHPGKSLVPRIEELISELNAAQPTREGLAPVIQNMRGLAEELNNTKCRLDEYSRVLRDVENETKSRSQ